MRAIRFDVSQQSRWIGLAFALITLFVFRSALSPHRVFFERDVGSYICPEIESLVRAVGEGAWPTWNPWFTFGTPLWEDPAYQATYPPTWLNLFVSAPNYYKIFVFAHCWLAAVGMYAFLRALQLRVWSSFVGGVVWGLSGPFLSTVSVNHHFASASWIGWVLFALARLLARPSPGRTLILAGTAALLALAGSADVAVVTAFLGACLVVAHAPVLFRDRRVWGYLAGAVVLAALLSAIQWLPTVAYVKGMPTRASLQPEETLYWSVHPASLADLFVPTLVAELPWSEVARAALFESRGPFLLSLYLGVSTLGLVLLVLITPKTPTHRALIAAFGVLLLLSLGRHVPGAQRLLSSSGVSIPFRYPVKALIAGAAAWAALAGMGFELWLSPWDVRQRRRGAWIGGLLCLAAVSVVACAFTVLSSALVPWLDARVGEDAIRTAAADATFRIEVAGALTLGTGALLLLRSRSESAPTWCTLFLSTIVLLDLVPAGSAVNGLAPSALLSARPRVLQAFERPWRDRRVQALGVMGVPGNWTLTHSNGGPAGWEQQWTLTLAEYEWLIAPSGARWGLAGAYDSDFDGLIPAPIPLMGALVHEPRLRRRLLEIGAVEYVTGVFPEGVDAEAAGWAPVGEVPSVFDSPVRLFRVVDRLPRTYVVGRARVIADTDRALRRVLEPKFDPRSEVVLGAGRELIDDEPFQGTASIAARTADRVSIDVEVSRAGYVVLVESYAKAWRATVDGAPAEVLRANAAFRAVAVPAGRHRVEMSYRPRTVLWGIALSAGTLIGAVAWGLRRGSPSAA
jgi:hypothetical protein